MDTRPGSNPETFVIELVQRWLTLDRERLALRGNGPAMRGLQWKNVCVRSRVIAHGQPALGKRLLRLSLPITHIFRKRD